MPPLSAHHSSQSTKLLLVGNSGCLAGDTIVSAKRGQLPKKLTLEVLYNRVHGSHFNRKEVDTEVLCDFDGYVGLHKMHDIVKSGIKDVYLVRTKDREIKATLDHKFKTDNGWQPLSNLSVGDAVYCWRFTRTKENKRRDTQERKDELHSRVYIYSIPYHPFGQRHFIAGKNYKRLPKARIVIEAAINGLTIDEFITILREEPLEAAELQYLPEESTIHHKNEDFTDDRIENLEVISTKEHNGLHHEDLVRASKGTELEIIEEITHCGKTMTYDIMMEGDPHNFIANGFVVHNSGKTGSLASLAAAGYRLRIIDLDNKLDVLKNYLTDPTSMYYKQNPKCADNVQYVTLTETKKSVAGRIVSAKSTVWENMMNLLNNWQEKDEDGKIITDLGGILTWSDRDVLVIDSLSRASLAAHDHHLKLNGALMTERTQNEGRRDIGAAQDKIKNFLMYLSDESIKCNVIIICHITQVSESGYGPQNPAIQEKDGKGNPTGSYTESILGFPATIGRALSPHVPEYFPNVLHAKTTGVRNFIHTKSTGEVATICTAPLKVANQYPIETGLADYFKAVRGENK